MAHDVTQLCTADVASPALRLCARQSATVAWTRREPGRRQGLVQREAGGLAVLGGRAGARCRVGWLDLGWLAQCYAISKRHQHFIHEHDLIGILGGPIAKHLSA